MGREKGGQRPLDAPDTTQFAPTKTFTLLIQTEIKQADRPLTRAAHTCLHQFRPNPSTTPARARATAMRNATPPPLMTLLPTPLPARHA